MAKKPEYVKNAIMASINGNIHVHDASHLTIDAKIKGFLFWKRHEIHVLGRVNTDREKEEIDKILETETEGFTVINKLRVHNR